MRRRDFLEDVAELAKWGATVAGAAMRLGTSEDTLKRRLHRDERGRALLHRLAENGEWGHLVHGTVRRWAS